MGLNNHNHFFRSLVGLDREAVQETDLHLIKFIMNGIDGVFGDADADNIFGIIEAFNEAVA